MQTAWGVSLSFLFLFFLQYMLSTSHKQAVPAGWLATHRLVWGGRGLLSHSSRSKYSPSPSNEEWSCTELHAARQREGQAWRQSLNIRQENAFREKLGTTHKEESQRDARTNKLTCWVRAFCSHSGLAAGNPAAPLNWTENPGGARWQAGTEGARWTAPLLSLQCCRVPGAGACPPPGPPWLTSEQLLLPLERRKKNNQEGWGQQSTCASNAEKFNVIQSMSQRNIKRPETHEQRERTHLNHAGLDVWKN